MFDSTRIAAQANKRAKEERRDRLWMLYERTTTVLTLCLLCFGIFMYVFLSNSVIPADDSINIDPVPIPLAAPPSDSQTTEDSPICSVCGRKVDKTD